MEGLSWSRIGLFPFKDWWVADGRHVLTLYVSVYQWGGQSGLGVGEGGRMSRRVGTGRGELRFVERCWYIEGLG